MRVSPCKPHLSRLVDQPRGRRVLGMLGGTLGLSDDFLASDPEVQALFEGE